MGMFLGLDEFLRGSLTLQFISMLWMKRPQSFIILGFFQSHSLIEEYRRKKSKGIHVRARGGVVDLPNQFRGK